MSRLGKKSRFSSKEDDLLLQRKEEGLSWDEISEHFSKRTKGTLQVHYSTKLKPRLETSNNIKKRRRSKEVERDVRISSGMNLNTDSSSDGKET
jgi:hypothetical protein